MDCSDDKWVLRAEFDAEAGTFLAKLRTNLTWDKAAFSRLISAMESCAKEYAGEDVLPRWIAEGFWFIGYWVQEWTSHPNFSREHPADYYEAAYERLRDLAFWLFVGKGPSTIPLPPL